MALLCCLVFSGCQSTPKKKGYTLTVTNNSRQTVKNVEIIIDDAVRYRLDELGFQEPAKYVQGPKVLPQEAIIQWQTESGEKVVREIKPKRALAENFNGRIFYQIDPKNEARGFYEDGSGTRIESLPWSLPAGFELSPTLPGFSGGSGGAIQGPAGR